MLTLFIIGNLRKLCHKINSIKLNNAFEGSHKKLKECMYIVDVKID